MYLICSMAKLELTSDSSISRIRRLLAESKALLSHPMVAKVLHPALPGDPGHALWRRDFTGVSGLFAMVLQPVDKQALCRFFERLELFGIGLSWGGFESLALPMDPPTRTVRPRAP